jgi:hypothetical protein
MPSTCSYTQTDGFLYDYQMILSDSANNPGNINQIFIGYSTNCFYFQSGNTNIRANIALNPYNSLKGSSFVIGKEYDHKFEIGPYILLSSNQKFIESE